MALTGALNGTDVALAVESAPASDTFNIVGGLTSNSTTFNNGAIDITNKSAASFRCLMDAEGLQSLDCTAEIIFSSDANFEIMRLSYLAKTILSYQIARDTLVLQFDGYITSWAETAPDNDKLTVSVSLQSSGPIVDATIP